jgi:hypothetical protein
MNKKQLKKIILNELENIIKEYSYSGANGAKDTSFYPKGNRGPVGGPWTNMSDPYGISPMMAPWGSVMYSFLEETDPLEDGTPKSNLEQEKKRHLAKKAQLTPDRVKFLGNLLNVNWDKVDINEFSKGLWIELEHGLLIPRLNVTNDNLVQTAKVALAHLVEDPMYYTKLKKYVEKGTKKECRFERGMVLEKKFMDFKKFKNTPDERKYEFLGISSSPLLGTGSSRQAFLVDSKSVLKMAINDKGIAQNKAELDIYTNPEINDIVNKIYDYDPSYKWLLVEVVKELKSEKEFANLSGVRFSDFYSVIEQLYEEEISIEYVKNPFIKMVWEAIEIGDLSMGDIVKLDHWGKTADGMIVLLDYGFTEIVRMTHYSNNNEPTENNSSNIDTNTHKLK